MISCTRLKYTSLSKGAASLDSCSFLPRGDPFPGIVMGDRMILRLMNTLYSLKTQLLAGLSVPLEDDRWRRPRHTAWLIDEARFEENPGRIGRNGLGSLEVGGGRDRIDR